MRRPGLFWGASLGGLILADVLLDRRHDDSTLSACTRATFRTHHPVGRVVFVAAYVGSSCWFVPHILKRVEGSLST
jgi:hypothetical protein